MTLSFYKYVATGNDFILIENLDNLAPKTSDFVKRICNRNFGIGADGVLYLEKKDDLFFMNLINSDGSSAKMCGNGIRCIAKHLFDKKLVSQKEFNVSTPSGVNQISLSFKKGEVVGAKVHMGSPAFLGSKDFFDQKFSIISMGNPHAVTFLTEFDKSWISKVAPKIESHPFFTDRTNVEFVQILNESAIRVVVFERGSGFTLACGTGACASVACAVKSGFVKSDSDVKVNLPGGKLSILVKSDFSDVIMEGDSSLVFSGVYNDSIA